ncbi:IS110 family RNA-guided transposase [Nafulsella turpanensis]|uniref:IS110 family transposase n=1 Tax=Nafulsella turpanensis TaxID=1265690 RepID=UPI00034B4667|nr:IS110 family transposase [Nafulsella turpanensis]
MKFSFFIGVDISKKTLDFAARDLNQLLFHLKVENSASGLKEFKAECRTREIDLQQSLICCEHTGIYSQCLLSLISKEAGAIWLESSLRIKRSIGLQRGKNDKVDAIRISEYALRFVDKALLWQPEREVLLELRQLVSLRKRLLKAKNALKVPLGEIEGFQNKKLVKELERLNKKPVEELKKQISEIEKKIRGLIKQDETLSQLFTLVTSVDGVGEVIFWEIITTTNEFKLFSCPRKFACYAGVSPFEHSSGTSIRGKTRVSQFANKKMKKLFHMGAMAAICKEGELADYYYRKVAEGKSKMAVLNAVRNKIIHRIFACVRENRKYEKNYINALA